MTLFYKLYQPLWIYSYKFHKDVYFLSRHVHRLKKVVPLHALVAENADIYKKIIKNVQNIEWGKIREEVLKKNIEITSATVDSTIIDMCIRHFHVDNAIAYFKFLKKNNYPINMAMIGKYLGAYALKQDDTLTDADKAEIVKTYNSLRQKHPYVDSITAEACIKSLCLTNEWEKAYELIEMIKIVSTPGTAIYSTLAGAAFRNGKADAAWKVLSKIIERKQIPQSILYKSHLQYCQLEDAKGFNRRMEEMFDFWAKNNVIPYDKVVNTYVDTASKYGWSTRLVKIPRITGNCQHCGHSLSRITFSEEEFQKLAKSIMDKVIIGSDIYCKTNPKELSRFKTFIESIKPYDVVVDGLNLTYIQKKTGPQLLWLINIIEHFSKLGKKILVFTRKHQKKLSVFKQVERKASVFLVDDLSADDPYMLYATMASGINTMYISSDFMREHYYSLRDQRLQQTFEKWQSSHQYFIKTSKTGIRIQEPFNFTLGVQKNNDCWHVPLVNEEFRDTKSYDFSNMWYCFKRNN